MRAFGLGLAGGLGHAALMTPAFPPLSWWPLAFVAALPLFLVAWRADRPWARALGATLGVAPMWAFLHWWIFDVSALGAPFLVAYLSLYAGAFTLLASRVRARLPRAPAFVALPLLWAALEVVRAEALWDGYPWYQLAHPTIEWAGFAGLASLVGATALSEAAALPGATAVDWITRRRRSRWAGVVACAAVAALALTLGGAGAPAPPEGTPTAGVAVVQTNTPQSVRGRWSAQDRVDQFAALRDLTREAAAADPAPDLIVWPETMFPGLSLSPEHVEAERAVGLAFPDIGLATHAFADALLELQTEVGIPMLVGAIGAEGVRPAPPDAGGFPIERDRVFNSVFLVEGGRVAPKRYDKMELTPFGEVMPYISAWPWLEARLLALGARGMSFDLDAGREAAWFETPAAGGALRVVTPICFEATSPGLCARLAGAPPTPPHLMINVTNDGWFGGSPHGRESHLLHARWRCVELRTPMVRAANTGVSAMIDGRGRVVALGPGGLPGRRAGVMLARVPIEAAPPGAGTAFARVRPWPEVLLVGAGALLVGATFLTRRPPAPRTEDEGPE